VSPLVPAMPRTPADPNPPNKCTVKRMPPQLNRMYGDLAHLWPLISRPCNYAGEAGVWREALRAKLGPGRHEILELGAGGGHNLSHLTADFQATAVDSSPGMLEHCQKLNPDVPVHVGDMRSLRLGRRFKAVLIHDAISYMLTLDDLRRTFATAAAHLDPGGIFIVCPDYTTETFRSPYVSHTTYSDGETEVTCIQYDWDADPSDTVREAIFCYMIRTGSELRVEQDRHVQGLFTLQTWFDLLREEGFSAEKWPHPILDEGKEMHLLVAVLGQ
jgi:SAM-dependent methyltransferase